MARGTWGDGSGESLFRVKVQFRLNGQPAQTGFHLRDIGFNTFTPQQVAEHVQPWVQNSFRTILTTTDTVEGIDVLALQTAEGGSVSFSNTTGAVAGTPQQIAPAFLMATVSLKGELRKRYGQGRMFWPVRVEDWYSLESLNTAGIPALQAVVTALTDRYLGSTITHNLRLVNVHGPIDAKPATADHPIVPAVPASWYDVTSARLSTAISSLRSRKA